MDDERVKDSPQVSGAADRAWTIDQAADVVDLEDMLAKLEDRENPATVARQHAERSFLRDYVFRGLNDMKPVFDSPEIAHFNAADFLRLVHRCTQFGVRIVGVEIFTTEGQMSDIEIPEADSNSWCVSLLQKHLDRSDLSICATYDVSDRVLSIMPGSLKFIEQA